MNVEDYRRRLLEREQELVNRLGRELDIARETAPDQADVGDLAVADELKEEYFTIAQTDSEILTQVRAALRRIDDGAFGRCTVDGKPIEEKRLEAVPWTPFCQKHQQEIEAGLRLRTPTM
jgi:DnaK suppressor protein